MLEKRKINSVLVVGGGHPLDLYKEEISGLTRGAQLAANNFELSLVGGIAENTTLLPHLISAPFLPSYPLSSSHLLIKSRRSSGAGFIFSGVSYINLPIIKNIFKYFGLSRRVVDQCLREKFDLVVCNTLNLAQLASVALHNFGGGCIKCVVIMDLPIFPGDCSFLYRFYLRFIEWPFVRLLLKKYDYFVIATPYIADLLSLPENRFSVLDGLYLLDKTSKPEGALSVDDVISRTSGKFRMLYGGSLDERYSVKSFLEDFHEDRSIDAYLIICGSGPLEGYVNSIAALDGRIIFLGVLSVSSLRYLQSNVDLLVNPRSNFGEYNLYSFPSKTLEYMASSTPVLMNKLSCLSSEYQDLLYFPREGESFVRAIKRVMKTPVKSRLLKSDDARKFVIGHKTAGVQISRVFSELLSKINM